MQVNKFYKYSFLMEMKADQCTAILISSKWGCLNKPINQNNNNKRN